MTDNGPMSYTLGRQATHCAFCGAAFDQLDSWPRDCPGCGETTWANPLPVAVTLLPVNHHDESVGLVVVRRTISPGYGLWALPGGYIEIGETWQQAAVRELWEESGIKASHTEASLFGVDHSPTTMQVFALLSPRPAADLPPSAPTAEASGWDLIDHATELAFPTHTHAVARFFG